MALTIDNFKEIESGVFETDHLSEDNHDFGIYIRMDLSDEEQRIEDLVAFVQDFVAQEVQIRQRAAKEMFAKNEEIQSELGYATEEDLFKALRPGNLYLRGDQYDLIMTYLSPLDDLKMSTGTYVIMASQDLLSGELEIHLEQESDV